MDPELLAEQYKLLKSVRVVGQNRSQPRGSRDFVRPQEASTRHLYMALPSWTPVG